MAFVVDNSIAVAWCVSSQADRYSRAMIERSRREAMHAPHIWALEFLNALRVLERRGQLSSQQVNGSLAKIARLRIVIEDAHPRDEALLDLSRQLDLSIYDACYIEIAQRRGLPLATRDAKLRQAARAAGIPLA